MTARHENKTHISYGRFGLHRPTIGGRFAPRRLCGPGGDAPSSIVSGFGWARMIGDLVVDTSKLESVGWRPAIDTYEGLLGMMRAEDGESAQL